MTANILKSYYFFIVYTCVFLVVNFGYCSDRAIVVTQNTGLSHDSDIVGKYFAIIIGIDMYFDKTIPDLKSAVKDAEEISKVLKLRYGFTEVILLTNKDATRYNIDKIFRNKLMKLKSNDSLLVYFSGHGDIDRQLGGGWWIPVDAKAGVPSTYIDNTLIQKYIKSIKAKHVLLISDSCYSGTLFGETRKIPPIITNQFYLDLYNEKSRWGMTSGNVTPVSDQGTNGHSIFAYHLLKFFSHNYKPYITPREIYANIGPMIRNNSAQMPLCRPIKNTGDQGGEFVFILKVDSKKKKNLIKSERKKTSKGCLYVNVVPVDARVRILNIRPVFYQGIPLSNGKYRIEISKEGYAPYDKWIKVNHDQENKLDVTLKKIEQETTQDNNFITKSKLNIDTNEDILKPKKFNQKEIFDIFKTDYNNNKNLSFSYNILLNQAERYNDNQFDKNIALITGSYYKEIEIDRDNYFCDFKFFDNHSIYYVEKKDMYSKKWKIFMYDLLENNKSFIYSDDAKMIGLNNKDILVIKNNKPYLYNLKLRKKTRLGFKVYDGVDCRTFKISPNKKYLLYQKRNNKKSHLCIYNLSTYKNTPLYMIKNDKLISVFFSQDDNYFYYCILKDNNKYQIIKYNLVTKDKSIFLETYEKLPYRNYISKINYLIFRTYNSNNSDQSICIYNPLGELIKHFPIEGSIINLRFNNETLYFHKELKGYSAIWRQSIDQNETSDPVILNAKSFEVSPNGKKIVFYSTTKGYGSLNIVNMIQTDNRSISINCKKRLKDMIEIEDAKGTVHDFIYEAIINKSSLKGKKYLANESNLNYNISNDVTWDNYLKKIGYWKSWIGFNSFADNAEITIYQINGDVSKNKAAFIAYLDSTIKGKGGGVERLKFNLLKINNSWKIQEVEDVWDF